MRSTAMDPEVVVSRNNIHVKDSYEVSKHDFETTMNKWRQLYLSECEVLTNRTNGSMAREWALHNLCYDLGIQRARSADVDLNWPQKWWVRAIYGVIGSIALLLIK